MRLIQCDSRMIAATIDIMNEMTDDATDKVTDET
jgi:hypothetical protein